MGSTDINKTIDSVPSQPQVDEEPQHQIDPETTKRKNAFSNISRELTESDLKSLGTQRLLLRDLDNYEVCKRQLEDLQEKYHKADRENGVFEVKLRQYQSIDYLYSFLLGIGSALIGLFPALCKGSEWYLGVAVGVLGLAAFFASVIIKHRN